MEKKEKRKKRRMNEKGLNVECQFSIRFFKVLFCAVQRMLNIH